MRSMKTASRYWRKSSSGAVATAIVLLTAIVATGQDAARRGNARGGYPHLPGAVTKAPAWVRADAPFDVARLFEPMPRDKNAAPLYLDALFEFSSEVESCFPEGPDRNRRSQSARDRSKRYGDLTQPANAGQNVELDAAAVDELIKLYDAGYRKLADAQRLDHCVFETGIAFSALLPHAQVARQVFRVSSLKVQRAVQRGELATAIREIEMVLRLARDLRPRGVIISQLVADAVSQAIYSSTLPIVLSSPRLRAEHCERLIKVLTTHEAKSLDGFAEGLRAQYVNTRSTLEDLVHHPRDLANAMGLKPGESLFSAIQKLTGPSNSPGGDAKSGNDWDALIARTSPAELSRHVKEITRYYRALLDLNGLPYAERFERIRSVKVPAGTDQLTRLVTLLLQPESNEAVAAAAARTTASLRAMECLLALRRWQMSHRGSPKDLSSVAKAAALKTVPVDPYDGKPMKLVMIDGQPVVYSVGRDGKDDGGLVDSNRDQKPKGDLIYRLPPIEEKHPLTP
jgi:hypothetical protein